MSFKVTILTAVAILNLLFSLSQAVGSTGTLAIGTGTVRGISAGATPSSIYCTNLSQLTSPYQILSRISFKSISAGTDFFCGIRSSSNALLCYNRSSSSTRIKRVHKGAQILSDLTIGDKQISAFDKSGNQILFWRQHQVFPESVSGFYTSLTSGNNFTCGLNTDRNVIFWGPLGSLIQSYFAKHTMKSIIAGESHMCGLDTSDVLICKGSNAFGQSNVPTGTAPFELTGPALGLSYTCALRQPNGTVICWGGTGTDGSDTTTYTPTGTVEFEFLVAGWGSNRDNNSVIKLPLPRILPGISFKSESDCSCGTNPDSDSLCTGTGVICKRCDY